VIVCGATSAHAGTVWTWPIDQPPNSVLGANITFTSNIDNILLTASGFITDSTDVPSPPPLAWLAPTARPTPLYAKFLGGDENGLGIKNDPSWQHEIFVNSFIQFDLIDLFAHPGIGGIQLQVGSIQPGEGFYIWGSNTPTVPGTLLVTGGPSMNAQMFTVPSYQAFRYVSISETGTAGNVLLNSFSAFSGVLSQVPDADSGFSMALGILLIALGAASRRLTRTRSRRN